MRKKLRNGIGLFCLTFYAAVLLLAALPVYNPFSFFRVVAFPAARLLAAFTLLPGLELFHRPYPEIWKVRGECLTVKRVGTSGVPTDWGHFGRGCSEGSSLFQWIADPYSITFHRFMEEVSLESRQTGTIDTIDLNRDSKEAALLAALGEFACLNPRSNDGEEPQETWLKRQQKQIHYASGREVNINLLVFEWDCHGHSIKKHRGFKAITEEDLARFEGENGQNKKSTK